MPRQAKPYLHRGWWVTNLGGPRQKLCPEEAGRATALDAFRKLQKQHEENGRQKYRPMTVAELFALFLASVKGEKSDSTFTNYQRWLTDFSNLHGNRLARDLTRLDAQNYKNDLTSRTFVPRRVTVTTTGKRTKRDKPESTPRHYKPKSINHAIITLKRCWNWGIETEILSPKNPFAKLPLLYSEGRQRVMTDEEFQALLRHSTDALFRQFLLPLRYTSARPGEIRHLTWPQVDWANHRFVIPRHKTSRTQRVPKPRIIPFPPCVENLLRWLQKQHGHQPYCFLNSRGRPWTRDALIQRMESLRRRANIKPDENGETLVLYHHRHTYLTAAAGTEGLSGPLLQQLAGHTDPRTTERYAHLANREICTAGNKVAEALRPHPRKPGK
jgi:integrase